MKFAPLALILALATIASAQTTTYIWNGSTDSSNEIGLKSVDGVDTSPTQGWGGGIRIVNGNTLALLALPQPGTCSTPGDQVNDPNCTGIIMPFLPNNSFLDCWSAITWGTKQWGVRADGTTMDGTQSGDFYNLPANTGCTLWNGSAAISFEELHQFEYRKVCVAHANRTCIKYAFVLQDIYVGGDGSVVGAPLAPVASLYLCGSKRHACLN